MIISRIDLKPCSSLMRTIIDPKRPLGGLSDGVWLLSMSMVYNQYVLSMVFGA